MSFVSSLPANLPKYGNTPTRDSARGREQYMRITYSSDYTAGVDRHVRILSWIGPVADSISGTESGFAVLAPKYLDLQTGKTTTEPTPESVLIGIGGVSGCVDVGGAILCYKKLGDVLDWETLQNLLTAFKLIEDRAWTWSDTIKKILLKQP